MDSDVQASIGTTVTSNEDQPVHPKMDQPCLKEYPLQSSFLHLIPAQAQKGLSNYDIEFTCIDADGHFIALGSNVGIVYLYDRIKGKLSKLRYENKETITCVKVLISLECLVVFGCKNGSVVIFKVSFTEDEVEKFTVDGFHNSAITSLEWAKNGMKVFSGDENGIVVCTEIDHFEHQSRSHIVLNEKNKIIQLSYNRLHLVISTVFRSIIYSCSESNWKKIGQKERYGPFGAVLCLPIGSTEDVIFAARPGQRLWKSDKSGTIHETMMFKRPLSTSHYSIPIIGIDSEPKDLSNLQFGHLQWFMDKYIMISSDTGLVVIDPNHSSVVASCPKLDPLIGAASVNDEIFVLRGVRHLIRISYSPDPYVCENKVADETSIIEEILVPLKELSTFVKERSDSFVVQTENSNIFGWLKKQRSTSMPSSSFQLNSKESESNYDSSNLPKIVKLETDSCSPVIIEDHVLPEINLPKIDITQPLSYNTSDDIVYKPKKKRNKKVRFRSVSPAKRSSGSTSKESSTESEKPLTSENTTDHLQIDDSDPSSVALLGKNSPTMNSGNANQISSNDLALNDKKIEVTNGIDVCDPLSVLVNSSDQNQNIIDPSSNDTVDSNLNVNCATNNSDNNNVVQKISRDDAMVDGSDEIQDDADDIYSSYDATKINSKDDFSIKKSIPNKITHDSDSLTSSDSFDAEPPKYGTEWVEFKGPDILLDIAISNDHIFCVDAKNQLYFSPYPVLGLNWKSLKQPAEKVVASPSESLVWVLYKGTVYSALQSSIGKWKDVEWISIARDVVSISVEDDCGWYVNSRGQLSVQRNLSSRQPYGYPENVNCKHHIRHVTSRDRVIWILTSTGSLYSLDSEKSKKLDPHWKKIVLDGGLEINNIHLGIKQTGWIMDAYGIIRFIIGVTPNSSEGVGKPWEVEASKYLVNFSGQLQKIVLKALHNEAISSVLKGKQQVSLSTSPYGVWFCKSMENLMYCNQKTIIGHQWDQVVPSGTASRTKWRLISTTGVTNSQGSIWCLNNVEELYCVYLSTNTPVAVELPHNTKVRCLAPSKEAFWLLSENGSIFIRRGITSACLEGNRWQELDLVQLSTENVTSISCAFQVAWACTSDGNIIFRLGSLCPSSNRTLTQAWIPVNMDVDENSRFFAEKLPIMGKKFPLPLIHTSNHKVFFKKVYVGPQGFPVWSVDSRGNVFVRDKVSARLPVGSKWVPVPELQAKELSMSQNAVWLLDYSGKIFRRFGVKESNPFGDYWKQIPGNLDFLSVTDDDDIWGLKDDCILLHSSFVLNCSLKKTQNLPTRTISEEDWEDITADLDL